MPVFTIRNDDYERHTVLDRERGTATRMTRLALLALRFGPGTHDSGHGYDGTQEPTRQPPVGCVIFEPREQRTYSGLTVNEAVPYFIRQACIDGVLTLVAAGPLVSYQGEPLNVATVDEHLRQHMEAHRLANHNVATVDGLGQLFAHTKNVLVCIFVYDNPTDGTRLEIRRETQLFAHVPSRGAYLRFSPDFILRVDDDPWFDADGSVELHCSVQTAPITVARLGEVWKG